MKYWSRIKGSQRASASVRVKFCPNFTGQAGDDKLAFELPNGRFLIFQPESIEDIRELQSQAAILAHNFKGERS